MWVVSVELKSGLTEKKNNGLEKQKNGNVACFSTYLYSTFGFEFFRFSLHPILSESVCMWHSSVSLSTVGARYRSGDKRTGQFRSPFQNESIAGQIPDLTVVFDFSQPVNKCMK